MTPDERREAHIATVAEADGLGNRWNEVLPDDGYDRLLAYFDEHEPAVADAIRYGLVGEMDCRELRKVNHALCIDYPQPDDTSHKEEA